MGMLRTILPGWKRLSTEALYRETRHPDFYRLCRKSPFLVCIPHRWDGSPTPHGPRTRAQDLRSLPTSYLAPVVLRSSIITLPLPLAGHSSFVIFVICLNSPYCYV